METQFPKTNETGTLPYDYYTHQLATCLDYAPTNKVYNFFLGGFNAHAAHHLYPRLPHTLYPEISRLVEEKTKEFNVPYHKLTLFQAIRSHYRYLKKMGSEINNGEPKCQSCKKCFSQTKTRVASLPRTE